MPQVVIENPILNSPYKEPTRHFKFNDEGITNEIIEGRRRSSYFIPIPRPKKKGGQLTLLDTQDRVEETKLVNEIRERVSIWRRSGYPGVTNVTRSLLEYWTNPNREKKLFFCQIEALETCIYITELAGKGSDSWIINRVRDANDSANPGLFRLAFKMATGTGKTIVMAMLICWHALNKLANTKDNRFSDTFLLIAPGITIRDRLRVLLPSDPNNYYRQRDIVPSHQLAELGKAKIVITNYHSFHLREREDAARLTKQILAAGGPNPFTETPDQMVRRVCRELGNKRNIIVINDEAHHCYRRKPDEPDKEKLKGEDRKEAERREEEARIWINGIDAVKSKIGVKVTYDLSATPFFLRGSGYDEGTLFPWVVSDFSLIDAIESGLVKVPRVPVSDDSGVGDSPTYRDLWLRIRDELPKKGRGTDEVAGEPKLPQELQGALHTLYSNYEMYYRLWERNTDARSRGSMPPVFIVVCNNTNVSKLVFDYIAGWEKKIGDRSIVQAGAFDVFRNDDGMGSWTNRPNSILVDSQQLESGEGMSDEFKKLASREIEEFKSEYQQRFPGREVDKLTDEDLLREVMNTVGKPGKLGEQVKCVVSVSMLTEGWDANTVTHILGVRAFGTQLLSEQVVGRALRRISYETNDDGYFEPEYAEVFGVPFSFMPVAGSSANAAKPTKPSTRVRALEDRQDCEITFPRLQGYRYEISGERIRASFNDTSRYKLSTADIPTRVESAPIVGESAILTLDDLKLKRPNEVAFRLADLLLRKYFRNDADERPWLFPQLLDISKRWLAECLDVDDKAFVQMLMFIEPANYAVERIYAAIVSADRGAPTLKPILYPYDTVGSSRAVDFDTTRKTFTTHFQRCHVNYVALDSEWEAVLAERIEGMLEVKRYVKNEGMNFFIPYVFNGEQHRYIPDFILCIDDGHGSKDLLNLIVEVSGEKKLDKEQKVRTAQNLWVPAVNNHGGFGRWSFIEVTDPWDAVNFIRVHISLLSKAN